MSMTEWARQRGTDIYVPVKRKGNEYQLTLGRDFISAEPPGHVVLEFWFTEEGDLVLECVEEEV